MNDHEPEPLVRNALVVSLLLCLGVGALALRPVAIPEPVRDASPAASQVPAATATTAVSGASGLPGVKEARAQERAGAREGWQEAVGSQLQRSPSDAAATGGKATGAPRVAAAARASASGAAPAASEAPTGEAAPESSAPSVPPRRSPISLTAQQRAAGLSECAMPDPGKGYFADARSMWNGMVHIPAQGGMTEDGGYDVIVHFHGGPSARRALVGNAHGVVLAGLDLGIGSGAYTQAFSSPLLFNEIRRTIEKNLRAYSKRDDAHIRHLALSAWSAGYGGVNSVLRQNGASDVDGVILLDGFHASYLESEGRPIDTKGVEPITRFARMAAEGQKFFFLTHSQIGTEGYASTTEMSNLLLRQLDLRRIAGPADDNDHLALRTYVEKNGFYLRGFGGSDEMAHCDHLRHLGDAVKLLETRWQTPAAQ